MHGQSLQSLPCWNVTQFIRNNLSISSITEGIIICGKELREILLGSVTQIGMISSYTYLSPQQSELEHVKGKISHHLLQPSKLFVFPLDEALERFFLLVPRKHFINYTNTHTTFDVKCRARNGKEACTYL